ncbi:MAG: hypothetical protein AMS24_01825 [Chlamydiae bacterium SM23_39]|nr:MAG: hypothetical protein AMS24_01825 [Chlamydiae bacterium SM23_39]
MKKSIIFSLLFKSLFAYSLFLINDSPFQLTAIIQGANGMFLGQEILQAGEQKQWSTDIKRTEIKEIYNAQFSLTPFTVIWKCSYEGYYSICTEISPGATVRANFCLGSKTCTPKPKEDTTEEKD